MGVKQDYIAYLVAADDLDILPDTPEEPINETPTDLSTLFDQVTARLREGKTNWEIRVEFNVSEAQVQLARELWEAEVAARLPDPVI